MNENTLTQEEQIKRGEMLAGMLNLKKDREGRYNTTWGTKTALGLFLTVQRIIQRGE